MVILVETTEDTANILSYGVVDSRNGDRAANSNTFNREPTAFKPSGESTDVSLTVTLARLRIAEGVSNVTGHSNVAVGYGVTRVTCKATNLIAVGYRDISADADVIHRAVA